MRGSSKSLSKYSKHKASGQAVVHLSGNDFYLCPHGAESSKLDNDRLIGEWLVIREKDMADHWLLFNSYSLLGGALLRRQMYEEADPLLLKGYQGMGER